jgi:pimeloyl-ACP methyl ester carboxylesterase
MSVVEREFWIKGRRIAARCWHDAALPPLLALHGWQDNAATFDKIAPLLSNFHIVAIDFAGHGFSDWRAQGMRYHTLDHVDDVLSVVDQLGWSRFALMGHSMGAGIGLLLAASMPDRLSKLVLIDGLGPWGSAASEAPQILQNALMEWRDYEPREERVFADKEVAVVARRRGFTPLSEEAARILCSRSLKAVEGGFSWTMDRRVKHHSSSRLTEEQVNAFISAITCPVLLIRATAGFSAAADIFDRRWAYVREGKKIGLPGGHHLHLDESPELVAQEIKLFLA